jgi:hypothetical protein
MRFLNIPRRKGNMCLASQNKTISMSLLKNENLGANRPDRNNRWNGRDNWQVRFMWGKTGFLIGISTTHTFNTRKEAREHIQELRKNGIVLADESISLVYVGQSDYKNHRPKPEIF